MSFLTTLITDSTAKIVLFVLDGLGGLPDPTSGLTELETANTPNMDNLARDGICGLLDTVGIGVTPGSGPGHLALFGYDPIRFEVGRGVFSALGVGMELGPEDVAARVNFCTIENGIITDRRAGRISTDENARLCAKIGKVIVEGVEIEIVPEKEHRAALVLHGTGLSDEVSDTDPQRIGEAPLECDATSVGGEEAERTARIVNQYISRVVDIISDEHPANMIVTRGFSKYPNLPKMTEIYSLKPAGIATYPMYKAAAKLVGMDLIETGPTLADEIAALKTVWNTYDFFFLHYKPTDSRGEDGDFSGKVKAIEEADAQIPALMGLRPDVLAITGDHSTPALLKMHSWHPSPLLFHSKWERRDSVEAFGETACVGGGLGRFRAVDLMALMLANAMKLEKFGA
ncbi:MAG: phosphoglycerate mutase [Actinobacteria bacterium RBG_19FT_COMBO_54_7]|uniref:Phosphoglycerate mutase n=1 Tax=Candidatus Solincola sediminis TaxID=1797199 RepID=A0A1F2WRM4_9ACTN|nr:MAG: phosphoglycerate mutase [Candidatus Solincola sediminis]OFW59937.1 MAG: phosphoglycerate mutase [Candidatus Solincola sediminis]OFW69945.1 MAG: phosphoglycerate mutase [Actinobacteria bacterium RBG_19FT_COMBO_54_7]